MNALTRAWIRISRLDAPGRCDFYRMLAVMLNRLPLEVALKLIHDTETDDGRRPDRGLGPALRLWRLRLRSSHSDTPFSAALAGWVPDADMQILQAGERTSELPRSLRQLCELTERDGQLLRILRKFLVNPLFALAQLMIFTGVVQDMLMPLLSGVLPRAGWTGPAWLMGQTVDVLGALLPLMLVAVPAILLALVWVLPGLTGRVRVVLDRHPPFSWYRAVCGGKFMLTLAAMIAAGISEREALLLMRRRSSRWLNERLRAIEYALRTGSQSFGEALHATGMNFPDARLIRLLRALGSAAAAEMPALANEWLGTAAIDIEKGVRRFDLAVRLVLYGSIFICVAGVLDIVMSLLSRYGMG